MKTHRAIVLMTALFAGFSASSQISSGYAENIKKGEALYQKKAFTESAKAYSLAFAMNGGKGTEDDRYNAACSYALAGNADSAFHYLFGAAEKNKYSDYSHITTDADLNALHDDKRWKVLLGQVKKNKEKEEAHYIKPVVAILDTVYQEDQKYRAGIVEMIQKEGMQSLRVQEQLHKMHYADSVNLMKIEKILDTYGWLGFDSVGRMGALTLFLVVQHAPLEVQKKYLPMLREAVARKQAFAANLALLEDRVAIREGNKQIYGSQVATDTGTRKNYLLPLADPDHVDERRAAVGLGPLAGYLKQFGIEWNPEEFKKKQEQEEKKQEPGIQKQGA